MRKIISLLVCLLIITGCSSQKASSDENKYLETYTLANNYLLDGDYEQAILNFKTAIEIDNKNLDAYVGLYNAYYGNNDYNKASEIINYIISDFASIDNYYQLMSIAMDAETRGDISTLFNISKKLIELDKSNIDPYICLCGAYLQNNQIDYANDVLHNAEDEYKNGTLFYSTSYEDVIIEYDENNNFQIHTYKGNNVETSWLGFKKCPNCDNNNAFLVLFNYDSTYPYICYSSIHYEYSPYTEDHHFHLTKSRSGEIIWEYKKLCLICGKELNATQLNIYDDSYNLIKTEAKGCGSYNADPHFHLDVIEYYKDGYSVRSEYYREGTNELIEY